MNVGNNVKVDCPQAGKQFAPEEISAQVLRKAGGRCQVSTSVRK